MSIEYFATTIGEQIILQRGFDITKNQQVLGLVPVISSGGISSYHNEAKVQGPGVVLGRKGSLGTVFYTECDYWPHDTSLWVKDFKGNNPRFVYYFFRNIADTLKSMDVGAANPALNRNHVHPLEVIWPIREQQNRIAEVLSRLDDKIAINTQTNQTLEQIAQAIFKSWFVDFDPVKAKMTALAAGGSREDAERAAMSAISGKDETTLDAMQREQPAAYAELAATAALFPAAMQASELGDVPEGWEVADFGSVSKCFDSKRIPLSKRQREQRQGNIPYYGATSAMDFVDEHIFEGIYLLLGEDGSVLRDDGTPFVQYIWGKSWVNNHAHVLQGSGDIETEQLKIFIESQNISAYVTGAVQLKLNQKNMNSIPFIKAPRAINNKFASVIEPFYTMVRSNSDENRNLILARDSLLPKLLSGEIDLSNLPDPAEAA